MTSITKQKSKILITAPEVAYQNSDYPPEAFELLYSLEDNHFWFKNRNELISQLIKKYIHPNKKSDYFELGCGTGYVTKRLHDEFQFKTTGADIFASSLEYAQRRLPNATYIQLDAVHMTFVSKFDIVGAYDVLEHISDDKKVMKNIYKALKPGGYFIVTVPQHMFMWSETDNGACHKRRYSRKELALKLEKAGFQPLFFTSHVFFLFPLMIINRIYIQIIRRFGNKKVSETNNKKDVINLIKQEMSIHPLANWVFGHISKLETRLILLGISFPFGGSLLCIAKKISKS